MPLPCAPISRPGEHLSSPMTVWTWELTGYKPAIDISRKGSRLDSRRALLGSSAGKERPDGEQAARADREYWAGRSKDQAGDRGVDDSSRREEPEGFRGRRRLSTPRGI